MTPGVVKMLNKFVGGVFFIYTSGILHAFSMRKHSTSQKFVCSEENYKIIHQVSSKRFERPTEECFPTEITEQVFCSKQTLRKSYFACLSKTLEARSNKNKQMWKGK